ncbi:MAG: hypothetical protein HQL28_04805 [Candidatus Omnitrophica bacterium]|nr:hypothetical protein [Candidatus Omnitrophota bacterium]
MKSSNCCVEVFSRVTGFFRPVQTWNEGKVEEFGDRREFQTGSLTGVAASLSERSKDSCR